MEHAMGVSEQISKKPIDTAQGASISLPADQSASILRILQSSSWGSSDDIQQDIALAQLQTESRNHLRRYEEAKWENYNVQNIKHLMLFLEKLQPDFDSWLIRHKLVELWVSYHYRVAYSWHRQCRLWDGVCSDSLGKIFELIRLKKRANEDGYGPGPTENNGPTRVFIGQCCKNCSQGRIVQFAYDGDEHEALECNNAACAARIGPHKRAEGQRAKISEIWNEPDLPTEVLQPFTDKRLDWLFQSPQ